MTPSPARYNMMLSTDGALWPTLLAGGSSTVVPSRLKKVVLKHDAVHQHTTYYKCMDDAVADTPEFTNANLRRITDIGVTSLSPGVWMGVYYKGTRCQKGYNSISLALTEHVYPPIIAKANPITKSLRQLKFPIAEGLESITERQIRSSIWPRVDFITEYLGVARDTVKDWMGRWGGGMSTFRQHESGLLYQFEIRRLKPIECLTAIKSGTWSYYIPSGENEDYWLENKSLKTDYRGAGRPK